MDDQSKQILRLFSKVKNSQKFYLTGATTLAEFYLHHRKSFDLDLFASPKFKEKEPELVSQTAEEFISILKKQKFQVITLKKHISCIELETTKNNQIVRLTIAFDTAPLLRKINLKKYGVKVASFEDIATAKFCALLERLETRDIIDIYFILKRKNIFSLIGLAKRRWEYVDEYQVATVFKKIESILPELDAFKPFLLKSIEREKIGKFYSEQAMKILDHLKK